MALDADSVIDRRRLKRRLTLWRIVAVVAVVLAVIAALGRFGGYFERAQVGRLSVEGVIVDDPRRDQALRDVAADDDVLALIVRIDSPGGTVVGGESLYRHLRMVAERKPVVVVMGAGAARRQAARPSGIAGGDGDTGGIWTPDSASPASPGPIGAPTSPDDGKGSRRSQGGISERAGQAP